MMATDPRFDTEYAQEVVPPRRSRWTSCLVGCLAIIAVMIVVAAVAAFFVARNWRGWMASGVSQVINQGIDASDLPAEEKQEIKQEVQRVTDAFRQGRLSNQQAVRIMERLANSPLMPLFIVTAVERQYFDKSGLNEEEKTEGRRTLQRFVRGAADGKIEQKAVDAVLSHIADRQPDGSWNPRNNVSDEDLRAALMEAKARADEAGIPEEPEPFDPSDEFKRIVDEAMTEPDATVMVEPEPEPVDEPDPVVEPEPEAVDRPEPQSEDSD